MAKFTGSLGYKGIVAKVDDAFFIIEERKINKDVTIQEHFNLTDQLNEYVGKHVALTIKEDEDLEPVDTN